MDALSHLAAGFGVALTPLNLFLALIGCVVGTAIGVLPGIGPLNAIALLLPFCFALQLPPESGLILLAAIYYGSGYGGRITAILLNMPGEPSAVLTTLDGHPLAKAGRGGAALAVSGVGSFVGATLSVVAMTFLSVPLAKVAVLFSPADYVALIAFALSLLGAVAPDHAAKTWAAGALGLLLAVVGVDSGTDGNFGRGDLRGVASPETADNAAQIGNMVPMLSLGIPGSGTTAVLLGALLMYNITPGPLLFEQRPDVVWGLIASMYVGNLMLLVLNLPLVGLFARLLLVPAWVLYPVVIALSFAGVYAASNSAFDLLLATFFGVVGWLFRKLDVPLVPIVLGFVLGRLLEDNLRRALSLSDGDPAALLASPASILLWALTAGALAWPLVARLRDRARLRAEQRRSAA